MKYGIFIFIMGLVLLVKAMYFPNSGVAAQINNVTNPHSVYYYTELTSAAICFGIAIYLIATNYKK